MVQFRRFLVMWVILTSCVMPAVSRSLKKDLSLTLTEKRVQELSTSGLILSFILQVTNNSNQACHLTAWDYRVVVEDSEFFKLDRTLEEPLSIRAAGVTLIALPVKVTYAYLFEAVGAAEAKDVLTCTLVGGLTFADEGKKGERLPIGLAGEFPVFKGIAVDLEPLRVRSVSIGGADLVFRSAFRNANGYELQAEQVAFSLLLGDTLVSEGTFSDGAALAPAHGLDFSLPLLLDFFEMGNDLYPLLRQERVRCRFSGEVTISTSWGRFKIPFESDASIPIETIED